MWTKKELEDWERELSLQNGDGLDRQSQLSLIRKCLSLMEEPERKQFVHVLFRDNGLLGVYGDKDEMRSIVENDYNREYWYVTCLIQ